LRAKAAAAASRGKDAETGEGEGVVPSAVEREPAPRSEPPIVQCVQCGKTEGPFSKCSGCHQTRYCSAGVCVRVCVLCERESDASCRSSVSARSLALAQDGV
jgi:hypothetical protein